MEIPELFARREPVFSFEFFLPKAPEQTDAFLNEVRTLKALKPSFVSLTYGAGGSARERTIDVVGRMHREVGIETVCHLTGITHTRAEMFRNIERIEAAGIRHIMALRGDQPLDWPGACGIGSSAGAGRTDFLTAGAGGASSRKAVGHCRRPRTRL